MKEEQILEELCINEQNPGGWAGDALENTIENPTIVASINPTTGKKIASVVLADSTAYDVVVQKAQQVFLEWRMLPAPKRGEIVREMGEELRNHKEALGSLVSLEVGKILSEGLGEVQESVDVMICANAPEINRATTRNS